MTPPRLLRERWRTLLGAATGAAAGAAYAHFIGCRTGTCAITSNAFTAAAFFGLVGALVATPGRPPPEREASDAPPAGRP